jgi:hypothetical protein
MDVGGAPPVELRAAMQQHFHQPHHAGVVNLNAGDFGFAGQDWQSLALKQREVDVHVEGLRFEAGETIRNGDEFPAQTFQVLRPLLRPRSFIRLTHTSTRRKVLNFSYMRPTRFLQ